MNQRLSDEVLGSVELETDARIVAGRPCSFRLTYTAGRVGVDDRGAVRVAWRSQPNLAHPQFDDPAGDNYVSINIRSVSTTRPVVNYNPRGHRRPYICALTVHTDDGGLWPGDQIEFIFGDTSGGGDGIRAPITRCRAFDFQIAVDPKGAQEYHDIPATLGFPVVAADPIRLVPIAPSDVRVGEPFSLRARFEDDWGNPAEVPDAVVSVREVQGAPALGEARAAGPVVTIEGVVLREPGIARVWVEDATTGLAAESNPVRVSSDGAGPRLWWGDLHGQSGESVGTNPSADYFHYARHLACADFTCHQANDFQIDDAFWARLQREVEDINQDGAFVCFHGYEWSGNTEVGGDRNVMFRDRPRSDDLIRSGHWLIDDHAAVHADLDAPTIEELYARFRGRDDVMFVPHVGGRRAEPRWLEPELEPVVEVHSAHGTSEWFLNDVLATGKQVGFIAGSDDHLGRPGATRADSGSFPVMGGLAAIWSPRLDRAGIWRGLHSRACYGTTGERILLDVNTAGAPMGQSATVPGEVPIAISAHGTAPIVELAIYRDGELLHRWCPPAAFDKGHVRLLVAWTGNLRVARGRKMDWHGELAVHGASLRAASGVAFDHVEEGLQEVAGAVVRWRSETAGDYDGVMLELADLDASQLEFTSDVVSFRQGLDELAGGPVFHDAPGLLAHVRLQVLPVEGPDLDVAIDWTDTEPSAGCHAYHVRVVQLNGHMAWSSPTWVTVG